MRREAGLVGRERESEQLTSLLRAAEGGSGGLLVVSGEAGVGKTRLVCDAAAAFPGLRLSGAATQTATTPYGPVVAALRSFRRRHPDGLDASGPLGAHLALLLPELGKPPPDADRSTLFEAVCGALGRIAGERPAVVVLDDLHWSDEATLELLTALAEPLSELPVAVVAAYRSDALPRDHAIRRLRHALRRAGRLNEIALEPLGSEAGGRLLDAVLGEPASAGLRQAVHDRAQGIPFFVEEIAAALRVSSALVTGARGVELADDRHLPIPETVRDAVSITISDLSAQARTAAETAAVAGASFDLELVGDLVDPAGLDELLSSELIREGGDGRASFRHALARDAVYAEISWLRRRALHRAVAEALERAGAPSSELASQWLCARDNDAARRALLRAASDSEAVHAYRDAADALRHALDVWGEPQAGPERAAALGRYATCCERSGELAEAARAWRELVEIHDAAGDQAALAVAHRELAAVCDLRGDRDAAFASRAIAADAFVACAAPAEAAVERLAMANQMRLAARYSEALRLARLARDEAAAAGRTDLRARALGMQGLATAKGGDYAGGVQTVRDALALALEHDLTAAAAELYQRLSVAIYDSSEYTQAQEALDAALDLCRTNGEAGTETACVSCLAYVLRERGDWAGAAEVCREMIASQTAVYVAEGLLGVIHAGQGRLSSARRLLTASLAVSSEARHFNMRVDAQLGLARVAAMEGDVAKASTYARAVLTTWSDSEDHHYAIGALRWSAALFARHGDEQGAHDCIEALNGIATETRYADALAALGHAIAETALAEGDAQAAADQLERAVEQIRSVDLPFQLAEIQLRAGAACVAAGEHEAGVERLVEAYRIARRLGARPLAAEAAREVAAQGESVVRRLGRRAAADADAAGLSRRELEVVRLLAAGRTNPEIARQLVLSRRTVDMHVRNILRKLDCRSRVEAATRAGDLGLLV